MSNDDIAPGALRLSAAALLLSALTLGCGGRAEGLPPELPAGAHGNALEFGIGMGWTDGFGPTQPSPASGVRVANQGAAVELDGGWRALPPLALGLWGFGAQLSEGAALPQPVYVYQAGAGIEGTWHTRPTASVFDPWLAVGTGWRAQWLSALAGGGVTSLHGIELARARLGVDLRTSSTVAIAPEIGASMTTFLTQSFPGSGWEALPSPAINAFVFAGVRATIDVPVHGAGGAAIAASSR